MKNSNSEKYMESVLKNWPTLKSNDKIAISGNKLRIIIKGAYMDGELGNTEITSSSDKYKIVFVEFDKFMKNFSDSLGKFFEGVNKVLK